VPVLYRGVYAAVFQMHVVLPLYTAGGHVSRITTENNTVSLIFT